MTVYKKQIYYPLIKLKFCLFLLPVLIHFGPVKLNTTFKTSTGDLVDGDHVYINANEGKLSLRVLFCMEGDSWLFVCVCEYLHIQRTPNISPSNSTYS